MKTYFWLSFVGDEGFRGACIVEAPDMISAVSMAHRLGCNPGGQVQGAEVEDCDEIQIEIEKWGLGKLITKEEMASAGGYINNKGEELT
jgi:hypothetical protein